MLNPLSAYILQIMNEKQAIGVEAMNIGEFLLSNSQCHGIKTFLLKFKCSDVATSHCQCRNIVIPIGPTFQ